MPTTLLFDLDNTLWDDDASLQACVLRVCDDLRAHLAPFDAGVLTRHYIELSDTYWVNQPYDPALLPAARYGFWAQTLATICGCDDPTVIQLARDAYTQYRYESAVCYDETHAVLEALHARYRLAAITNGVGEQQRARLESTGLHRYFDAVVASTDVEVAKPEAAVFHHTLRLLDARSHDAWHVGDSLVADVQGAHNAMLGAAVWLNRHAKAREETDPLPHHEVTSLQDFAALLQRFGG